MSFFHSFGGGMPGGGGGGRGRAPEPSSADTTKFYELLGVSKEADASEIKKAYRKAALQHHPDRGGDPEKFKEISKAHEILSDPEKRALYDEGGEEALEHGGGGGGGGPGGMDIFDLFGGGMFGGGMGGRGGRKKRGEDVLFPFKVTLEDLYNGTSKKLRLTKSILCAACKGKGGKNGAESVCSGCRGQGMKMTMRQIGPGMIQQVPMRCSSCSGTGSQIAEKDKCPTCHAERTVKEKKTLEVFISKGMVNGEKITYKGEADEAPDTVTGDVVVVIQMSEHPVFRRQGSHLFIKKTITLIEALTGFTFHVTHLDGRVLKVSPEAGMVVKPGQVKCVKEEGFPLKSNPYSRGNLYVEFDVQFPKPGELDEKALRSLSAVLPRPPKEELKKSVPPPNEDGLASSTVPLQDFYEVSLVSVDMESENKKNRQFEEEQERENYEEDDDHPHAQRAGPGCQQQ